MDLPIESDDNGVLRPLAAHVIQEVTVVGDPLRPTSIRFGDYGNFDELVAMNPGERTEMGATGGRFRSDTTGTEATISDSADGPRLVTVGRFGSVVYSLEYLADDIWRARSKDVAFLGGILSFDEDRQGFRFSNYRTWALQFRRCS